MTEIKALSPFQGKPQNNDQITDFQNGFIQQTQQFSFTSNSSLKGPVTKKIKNKQINKHNSHHVLTENVRQQNLKAQE